MSVQLPNRQTSKEARLLAGASAGAITAVLLQPLDVVVTCTIGSSSRADKALSPRSIVQGIIEAQGIRGLWRGTAPSLLRLTAGSSIFYGVLSSMHSSGTSRNLLESNTYTAFTGAFARICAALALSPVSVVKTRVEGDFVGQSRSTISTIHSIVRNEGVGALYKGILPVLMRDIPYSSLSFVLYVNSKNILQKQFSDESAYKAIDFVAGAIAGGTATMITHPLEIAKVRMQLSSDRRLGLLESILDAFRSNGFKGLSRGLFPKVIRRSLSTAISWACFSWFTEFYANVLDINRSN